MCREQTTCKKSDALISVTGVRDDTNQKPCSGDRLRYKLSTTGGMTFAVLLTDNLRPQFNHFIKAEQNQREMPYF